MAAIAYHMYWPAANDPFWRSNTAENTAKRTYYGVNAVPFVALDGSEPGPYPYYYSDLVNWFNTRIAIPSPLTISLDGTFDVGLATGTCQVLLTVGEALPADATLHVGVVENNVYWNGTGSYDWHNEGMRDLLTGGYGELLDPFNGPYPEDRVLEYEFYLDPAWLPDGYPDWQEIDIVAWVQENGNKNVLQAAWTDLENFEIIVTDVVDAGVALEPGIGPNSPNPFNPRTLIPIRMEHAGNLELGVYSTDGRLVRALASTVAAEGLTTFEWDGLDDTGRPVASGVYYVKMETNGLTDYRAITLLK